MTVTTTMTSSGLKLVHYDEPTITFPKVAPKVMVIASGHTFSTRDVYDNCVAGLQACGVDVMGFPYHEYIERYMPLGEQFDLDLILAMASDAAFPRAMAFRPDLILFVTGYVFPQAASLLLGQYAPTAVYLTEGPYQTPTEQMCQSGFRTAFTNERLMVERIKGWRRDSGHPCPENVYYLPHCYDPERHHPRDVVPSEYHSDVCFIGSPFPERQALFGGVDWDGIDFLARGLWSRRDVDQPLDAPDGAVSNDEAHLYYAGAMINVNHHRSIRYFDHDEEIETGEAESINLRAYELAAAGCFQICDDSRPELYEVFGHTIPTYKAGDSADLERVIRYWLDYPDARNENAMLARRIVQDHTAEARMRYLLEMVLPNG